MLRRYLKSLVGYGVVLLYHRVGSTQYNPLGLSVSREHFLQHLEILKKISHPVSLKEIFEGKRSWGKMPSALTFDDGYRDNLTEALPELEKKGIPATVFVTTGSVGSEKLFWWDQMALAEFPADEIVRECARMRCFEQAEIDKIISEVKQKSITNSLPDWKTFSQNELSKMARHPLIEIGSHTVTHPCLAMCSVEDIVRELADSKKILENWIGHKIHSVSYPYGTRQDFNQDVLAVAKSSGYQLGCINEADLCRHNGDRFQIPRLLVRDQSGDEFERWLSAWIGG